MFDELSKLSNDELQYVIDNYFKWAYKNMKKRGISIKCWKSWMRSSRRDGIPYCKSFPRIMVEEQIVKIKELITKAKSR